MVSPFRRVQLKTARPASEVFRLEVAAERVDYRARLDQFLAAVGGSSVQVASVESVLANVRSLGLSAAETKLAEEVLADAVHGGTK